MKKLNVLITVAFLLIWSAPDALATGFGYYGTLGKGTLRFDNDGWFVSEAHSTSRVDTVLLGGGMVLDTSVARNRVFNYRLNVGYEKLKVDTVQEYEIDRLESLVVDQDFGSAVYMSDSSRIWFGPELRVLIAHDEFAMGVGPVLGINLHTGKETTVALKLGFLFTSFVPGSADYDKESHAFLNLAILFRAEGDQY